MTPANVKSMTVDQLIERFIAIALAQDKGAAPERICEIQSPV
jgi:hypothetical protein